VNAVRALAGSLKDLAAGGAPPSRVVEAVLSAALEGEASDAHFEPADAGLCVRLRLDGVLQEAAVIPAELAAPVIARLKVLAALATYRTDVPQDGRIGGESFGRPGTEARLSTYPTVRGEKAVVRFFARRLEEFRLDALGLGADVTAALRSALAAREGLVALTGPAGSGKTTTIYSALAHLGESEPAPRQIVTIEDPAECLLPGVTQTETDPPAGLTFANCLRSILRQDPEVIMVGEVRDAETAKLALEAALTGHLVITTVHAGTAPGVIARLIEVGIEPAMVTGVLRLAVAQRLVRRLCPACRRQPSGGDWSAPGCEACLGTGYRGRLPVAEFLAMDARIRQAVARRADLTELQAVARESGMVSMAARGRRLAAEGQTSAAELARVLAGVGQ
jgi:general secretion pathway protein E